MKTHLIILTSNADIDYIKYLERINAVNINICTQYKMGKRNKNINFSFFSGRFSPGNTRY